MSTIDNIITGIAIRMDRGRITPREALVLAYKQGVKDGEARRAGLTKRATGDTKTSKDGE